MPLMTCLQVLHVSPVDADECSSACFMAVSVRRVRRVHNGGMVGAKTGYYSMQGEGEDFPQ